MARGNLSLSLDLFTTSPCPPVESELQEGKTLACAWSVTVPGTQKVAGKHALHTCNVPGTGLSHRHRSFCVVPKTM